MPVFRVTGDKFEPLYATTFSDEGLLERKDIQRRLRDQPEILEEGLFILAEEYSNWEESNRRIDLLALDSKGRLVVIEIKRSDQDSFMDLQAIRYAAMVANMTLKQAEDAHSAYIRNRGGHDKNSTPSIGEHLADDVENTSFDSGKPRIILVSANFSKELTTSVLWLNEIGADITCVKLQPWKNGDDVFLESSQVIPVPEAKDYMVRMRNREEEAQQQKRASSVETFPGSDQFREAIETAREDRKPMLKTLLELAVSLEKEGLAKLLTRAGSTYTNLWVQLPNKSGMFFHATKDKFGDGYLVFGSTRLLESLAPKSKERLERILNRTIKSGSIVREPSNCFLKAMTDAYREANGQPVD